MFDFFQPVMDFFEFIVNMLKTLINMVVMAVTTFTTLLSFLPTEISVCGGILIVVCVVYKILGRENQS